MSVRQTRKNRRALGLRPITELLGGKMTSSFSEAQEHLMDEFLRRASAIETDEELGAAFLDFVLQRERVRHRVVGRGPEQEQVDRQTLERLYHQTELSSEYAVAESVFKRLAKDPTSAIRYVREAVETWSIRQTRRAKEPRRKDALGKVIDALRDYMPDLTEPNLREELKDRRWTINSDEIRSPEGESFPPKCLKDRLYRAKKEGE